MITFDQLEVIYQDHISPYWTFRNNMQEVEDAIHSFMILRYIRPFSLSAIADKLECKKLSTGEWIVVSSFFPRIKLPEILIDTPGFGELTYKDVKTSKLLKIIQAVSQDCYPTFQRECERLDWLRFK